MTDFGGFFLAYVKAMKLYYSFITGIAGWIGVSIHFWVKVTRMQQPIRMEDYFTAGIILIMLFLTWGVNQVFNDWFWLPKEPAKVPNSPMETGELPVRWALALSGTIMVLMMVATVFLNPWALIPLALGCLLNLLYNFSKAWGFPAHIVFGVMIANCSVYAALAVGPMPIGSLTEPGPATVFALIAMMNGVMTFFITFKNFEHDRAQGKTTFIVRHGIEAGRWLALPAAVCPTLAFFAAWEAGFLPYPVTHELFYCGVMTIFLQVWTAIRFIRTPLGPRTHFANVTNIRTCACGLYTIIPLVHGLLAL